MQINPLPGNGMIGFPSNKPFDMRFQALRLPVAAKLIKPGRNKLLFKLHQRGPGSDRPLQVRRVELVTRLGAGRQVS
jgi:hypothetical protein